MTSDWYSLITVEFEPNQTSSDDEETIEAEEKGNSADTIDHTKEIEMLKRESQLPLEDLLNQLPEEYLNDVEKLKPIDKVRQCCKSSYHSVLNTLNRPVHSVSFLP